MSIRDRGGRAAQMRAERVRWRGRSRSMSQASRNMSERLRRMNVGRARWTCAYIATRRTARAGTRSGTTPQGLANT